MPAASRVLAFLFVFTALFLFALVITIVSEFSDVKWVEAVIGIGEGLGRLTLVSIAIAFILVEGMPMLAAWYKKQMVKEAEERGREEGLMEGREGERKAWQDWRSRVESGSGERRRRSERAGSLTNRPRSLPMPTRLARSEGMVLAAWYKRQMVKEAEERRKG